MIIFVIHAGKEAHGVLHDREYAGNPRKDQRDTVEAEVEIGFGGFIQAFEMFVERFRFPLDEHESAHHVVHFYALLLRGDFSEVKLASVSHKALL